MSPLRFARDLDKAIEPRWLRCGVGIIFAIPALLLSPIVSLAAVYWADIVYEIGRNIGNYCKAVAEMWVGATVDNRWFRPHKGKRP
jgi:hypothetical protein